MKRRSGIAALVLALAFTMGVARGAPVDVKGRVVDAAGKPLAGAEVACYWYVEEPGRMKPSSPHAETDADGRFTLRCEVFGPDVPVLAIDATGERGGLVVVEAKEADRSLRIEAGPLFEIRGHFTCKEAGSPPGRTGITMSLMPGDLRVAECRSPAAKFAMKLPPGRYRFAGGGRSSDYVSAEKEVALGSGPESVLDMGAVDLKLTPIARHYGKEPPAWHVTAARGVNREVRLSDFKGKWVVIDFWGFWCGPCVSRSLPGWIDFCEDHALERDKFEVLAFHDPQATDFAMLDEKLEPIVRSSWRGRPLPFPILLDTTGETVKDFGVVAWPTALLIDPDGHLVNVPDGVNAEDYLARKLPPLPPARRIARALDRDLGLSVTDDTTLAEQMVFLSLVGRIKIHLDPDELKAARVDANTPVPCSLRARLTLRAWLNLSLRPFGLTYVADGEGLRVVRRTDANDTLAQASPRQAGDNARVEQALTAPVPFDFKDTPLDRVVSFFGGKTGESLVLDPAARKSGAVRPEMTVTGAGGDDPLHAALKRLLSPRGMTYVVRDEAVVFTVTP